MKLSIQYVVGTLMLIMLNQGCEREEILKDRYYPRLDISEEVVQDQSGITFEGIFLTRKGEIQDKGFVWDLNNPSLNKGSKLSVGEGYTDGVFKGKAVFDLDEGHEYQVKAYIIHEGTTVYSKPVSFTSTTSGTPHSLESFWPRTGLHGDTVEIRGINLSYKAERITVRFNNSTANILSCTDTTIFVSVPLSLNEHESLIQVYINGIQASLSEPFRLSDAVIHEIQPGLVNSPGEQFTIIGSGFNPHVENNQVMVGSVYAQVSSATVSSLKAVVPDSLIPDPEVSLDTTVSVKVITGGKTLLSPDSLRIDYDARWTRMNDFPGSARKYALAFGNGARGFYGLGSNMDESLFFSDLWEYDPDGDLWTERAPFPGTPRIHFASFMLDQFLYLSGGATGDPSDPAAHSIETWRYDMETDQWTRLNDFPGTARIRAAGFAANARGFLLSGCHENDTMNMEVWEYQTGPDLWNRKNDLLNFDAMPYDQFDLSAFGNGETGVMLCRSRPEYTTHDSWVFDPDSDSWTGTGFPGTYDNSPAGSYIGDFLYLGPAGYMEIAEYERIYTYDQQQNSWSYAYSHKSPSRYAAGSFSIGERLYFFGGQSASEEVLLNDVWMLDINW